MKTVITIDWLKVAEGFGWLITMLAAVPYSAGEIANIFPPKWKGTILIVFGAATVITKVWRAVPALPFNKPEVIPVPPPVKRKRKIKK